VVEKDTALLAVDRKWGKEVWRRRMDGGAEKEVLLRMSAR